MNPREIGEGIVDGPHLALNGNEFRVLNGKRFSQPPLPRPVIVDADMPLLRKDGPVAMASPRNVISVRALGILPMTVRPMHTIELDLMGCPSECETILGTPLRIVGQPKRRLPTPSV